MVMNYKEVPNRASAEEAAKYATGIGLVNDFVNSLKGKGLLPERFSKPEVSPVASPASKAPAAIEAQSTDLINFAIAEYKKSPLIPELVTKTFQTIWQERGKLLVGVKFEVTPCPFTQEELARLEERGLRLGYLPQALATQESRHTLGEMFPKMQSGSVQKGNAVTNDESPFGWFDYEASIDAPYLDTTEKQLMDKLGQAKRKLLSENQYIIAGQDSKLFVGKYLDEKSTFVRVGSRSGGDLVGVDFGSVGDLLVLWCLDPQRHDPSLGGRSSGVNKA